MGISSSSDLLLAFTRVQGINANVRASAFIHSRAHGERFQRVDKAPDVDHPKTQNPP